MFSRCTDFLHGGQFNNGSCCENDEEIFYGLFPWFFISIKSTMGFDLGIIQIVILRIYVMIA